MSQSGRRKAGEARDVYCLRVPANQKADEGIPRDPGFNQDRDMWAMFRMCDTIRRPGDVFVNVFNVDASDLTEESVKRRMRRGGLLLSATRLGKNDNDDEDARAFALPELERKKI